MGRQFGASGWTSASPEDCLLYVLPAAAREGTVSFHAKGIRIGEGLPRQHIWGLYDRYNTRNEVKGEGANCNGFTLRIYHQVKDKHELGETRFRFQGVDYRRVQYDTPPLTWEQDRWYRFDVHWTPTEASWKRDGQVMGTVAYPDKGVGFTHLYLNNDNHHVFKGLARVVYRDVDIHINK